MATFNDIRGKPLERIIFYAFYGQKPFNLPSHISHKYLLSWICREWRKIVLPILYEQASIVIIPTRPTSELPKINSNIRLIVENGLSRYTQCLDIGYPDGYIDTGYLIELLDKQFFNRAIWSSIRSLKISGILYSALIHSRQDETSSYMRDTVNQYFDTHLPALTSISAYHSADRYATDPLTKLINLKVHRLSELYISEAPVNFTHHSFSSSLTHLTLYLSAGQTTLPYIYTPTLRELYLSNIPPNFSWRCFFSESNALFDFSALEIMVLRFSVAAVNSKAASSGRTGAPLNSVGSRKIYMPKAKRLSLYNMPPSDTQLFGPFLSYLDSVDISGNIGVLKQMDLRFPYCNRVEITLHDFAIKNVQEYITFTESLFGTFSIATEATFQVEHYIPISINTVGWLQLKGLDIYTFISLTTLYRLVSQLPLLEVLRVRYITPGDEPYQYDNQQDTSRYSHDYSNFNSKLQSLDCFSRTTIFPLVFNLNPLYEFITNVVTLKKVIVPEYYRQEIKDHFDHASMQEYPHLHSIEFTQNYNEFPYFSF